MRYLVENNEYYIIYNEIINMTILNPKIVPVIEAWLMDKYGNDPICAVEHYKGKLEPCLMKLGKKLIKIWRKTKK